MALYNPVLARVVTKILVHKLVCNPPLLLGDIAVVKLIYLALRPSTQPFIPCEVVE